jgi:hypothetical protein
MIILSNSPAVSFPDNTSAKFTVPLNEPLVTPLEEKWKVALLEAIIPNSFFNVESEDFVIMRYRDGRSRLFNPIAGIFDTLAKISKRLLNPEFRLENGEEGLLLFIEDGVESLEFSRNLSKLLGFPRVVPNQNGPVRSVNRYFDPWVNHRITLIHSDLVKKSQVNAEQQSIIQSLVPLDFDFHDVSYRSYFPPDYLEVQGEYHTNVSFKITDLDGNLLKFRSGNVVLVLHFIKDGAA